MRSLPADTACPMPERAARALCLAEGRAWNLLRPSQRAAYRRRVEQVISSLSYVDGWDDEIAIAVGAELKVDPVSALEFLDAWIHALRNGLSAQQEGGSMSHAEAIVGAVAKAGAVPDPDLIEARSIVKATLTPDRHQRCNCRAEIDAGEWDEGQKVRAALAGIRRGRQLASVSL